MAGDMDSYARNLKNIEESIKRHNAQLKDLRVKKIAAEERLRNIMQRRGVNEYEGYKLDKLGPKPKKSVKKKAEKKADAVKLFREANIDNPELFWDMFQDTQKVVNNET